jgi:hypothetical protein
MRVYIFILAKDLQLSMPFIASLISSNVACSI